MKPGSCSRSSSLINSISPTIQLDFGGPYFWRRRSFDGCCLGPRANLGLTDTDCELFSAIRADHHAPGLVMNTLGRACLGKCRSSDGRGRLMVALSSEYRALVSLSIVGQNLMKMLCRKQYSLARVTLRHRCPGHVYLKLKFPRNVIQRCCCCFAVDPRHSQAEIHSAPIQSSIEMWPRSGRRSYWEVNV